MDPLVSLLDRLLRFEEVVVVIIAQEVVFLAIAPAHHMADATGIRNSPFSRHTVLLAPLAKGCKHDNATNSGEWGCPLSRKICLPCTGHRLPPSSQLETLNSELRTGIISFRSN